MNKIYKKIKINQLIKNKIMRSKVIMKMQTIVNNNFQRSLFLNNRTTFNIQIQMCLFNNSKKAMMKTQLMKKACKMMLKLKNRIINIMKILRKMINQKIYFKILKMKMSQI